MWNCRDARDSRQIVLVGKEQGQNYALLMQRFDTGLLCMALIALLVTRRVIPFFASKAIAGLQIPMHVKTGHVQLSFGVLGVLAGLLQWPVPMAIFLALAGDSTMTRFFIFFYDELVLEGILSQGKVKRFSEKMYANLRNLMKQKNLHTVEK